MIFLLWWGNNDCDEFQIWIILMLRNKGEYYKVYRGYSSRKGEGYGLGLSICKRIIDLSKGEIHIDSELGRYTEILIRLPYE